MNPTNPISQQHTLHGRKQDQIDNDIDLDGPLLTNFESSDKKKTFVHTRAPSSIRNTTIIGL